MEKRHIDTILDRSEEYAMTGLTRFRKWELKTWYGADRISKTVWRSISEHLSEKRPETDLMIIDTGDDFIIFDTSIATNLKDKI